MHQNIAAVLTVAAATLVGLPAQAQSGLSGTGSGSVRPFLPVEAQYASAIQASGPKGLESEAAAGFVIRHGHEQWTGRAAFAQVYPYMEGIQGGRVAVTVRRVTIIGKTAVVLTREDFTFPPFVSGEHTATAMGTWYWKQTWKRTERGWKLAVLEPIARKALGPAPAIEYTVFAGEDSDLKASSPGPKTL